MPAGDLDGETEDKAARKDKVYLLLCASSRFSTARVRCTGLCH